MRALPNKTSVNSLTLLCLYSLIWFGCRQEIEVAPPPSPPPMEEVAARFQTLSGTFDEETEGRLFTWLSQEGGIGLLSALFIAQILIDQWLSPLSEGGEEEGEEGEGQEMEVGGITDQLKVDGWARLSLPCEVDLETMEQGHISLTILLSKEGFSPIIWGRAERCAYPSLNLKLDAEINLFLPNFPGLPIASGGWRDDQPQGVWVELIGDIELYGVSETVSQVLMLDTTSQSAITLWEEGGQRFAISVPSLDYTMIDAQTVSQLSFVLSTDMARFQCDLTALQCDLGED
jgi:hypothetical protein